MLKTSIRSKEQLDVRRKNFLDIVELLNKLEVDFFLTGGVVLGAIREKDLLKWDWDVDIGIVSDEFQSKFQLILDELSKEKFNIISHNKTFHHQKITFFRHDAAEITSFTLFGWSYNRFLNSYIRNNLRIPAKYIRDKKKIAFLGKEMFAPYPPEDYLAHTYGDWKTPINSSNKQLYLSKSTYKKNSFNIALNLDKIFRKLFK